MTVLARTAAIYTTDRSTIIDWVKKGFWIQGNIRPSVAFHSVKVFRELSKTIFLRMANMLLIIIQNSVEEFFNVLNFLDSNSGYLKYFKISLHDSLFFWNVVPLS
jgi:hypothetical protein